MKKRLLALFAILSFALNAYSQVGINTETPNATLDVVLDTNATLPAGVIAPRVTMSYLNTAIYSASQTGTIVYVTDINASGSGATENITRSGYYYFDGIQWVALVIANDIVIPTEPWINADTGEGATSNTQNIYQDAQVAIGKAGAADASAQLEVASEDKGFLIPRMNEIQRDGIANPSQSLLIWNTDKNCFNFWSSNKWKSLCGDLGESVIKITEADCNAALVVGTYKVGVPVNSSNYVEVNLQVIEPGSFNIEAQTNNGFFFQKSGTFSAIGTYTIQLPAIGSPNESGDYPMVLTLNGNSLGCTKQVTVAPADVKFTFDSSYCGAANTSAQDLVRGEASTGKTMKIKVNVINPGDFDFKTNTVNNVQYTASNVALTTGTHEVTLTANGSAPNASGNAVIFNVTGTGLSSGNGCEVPVNILVNDADVTLNCSGNTINGVYKTKTALTTSNYIEVSLNVTTLGNWTGTTDTVAGFSFSGSGNITQTGVQTVRLYATGTPTTAGDQVFTINLNGQTCTTNVTVLLRTKTVLLIGGPSASISTALSNTKNFGPTGTSKIEKVNVINGGNPNATTLTNYINNNNIDVIVSGWGYDYGTAVANVIVDFIKNKKGYFLFAQSQDRFTNLKAVLDGAYGTNVSVTTNGYYIYSSILPIDNSDPRLNGVFGNAGGKYVRSDDYASWVGITPATMTGPLNAYVKLPANGGSGTGDNSPRNTFIYADGFFMFPDWGTLAYTGSSYGNNAPISISTDSLNGYQGWNGSTVGTVNTGNTAGWVLFGNVMDHAFKYTEENKVSQ